MIIAKEKAARVALILAVVCTSATDVDWEDPAIIGRNTEPAQLFLFAYAWPIIQ